MRRSVGPSRLILFLVLVSMSLAPFRTVAAPALHPAPVSPLGPPRAPAAQAAPFIPIDPAPPPRIDPPPPSLPAQAEISSALIPSFGSLPLSFMPNVGQLADQQVRFLGRGPAATMAFSPDELLLTVPVAVPEPHADPSRRRDLRPTGYAEGRGQVRIRLDGANPSPAVTGTTPLPGVAHFFLGDQPSQQYTNVPTYAGIRYQDVYAGIDLLYDGSTGQLKSTYVVAPGVDPAQIRWRYVGAMRPQLDAVGNLHVPVAVPLSVVPPILSPSSPDEEISPAAVGSHTASMMPSSPVRATALVTVTEEAPIAWQELNGLRTPVEVRFVIEQNQRVGFSVGAYDPQHPLIIDPTLVFSSYLGGVGADSGNDIALDAAGNIYVTGRTKSATLPGGTGTRANNDAYVIKLNPSGSQVLYTTFIGGDGDDGANGIAVDSSGQVYIAGYTTSSNLPVLNAYQPMLRGGSDALVAKLTTSGTLAYLTYLGGSHSSGHEEWDEWRERATAIAINSAGEAHVTGSTDSSNFPVLNAFLATYGEGFNINDLFITKLASSGDSLIYSSFAGGSGPNFDEPGDITVDGSGNAYITGYVTGNRNGYLTKTLTGTSFYGAVVLKLTSSGARVFGTTFGFARGKGIAVDSAGAAYVTGYQGTLNAPVIPMPAGAFQATRRGNGDAFLVKLAPDGQSLQAGTFLGGAGDEFAYDVALDATGTAYITGQTNSTDFPTVAPIYDANRGDWDVFVAAITGGGSGVRYSTYLGSTGFDAGAGIAVTATGDAYLTGRVGGIRFPLVNPIQGQNSYRGNYDAFVAILSNHTILPNDQQNIPEDWCSCPPPQRSTKHPVNTRTGNFWFKVNDLAVQTPGPSIAWTRTYASQTSTTGTQGLPGGWRHPYASQLLITSAFGESNRTVIISANGNRLRFEDLGNNRFTPLGGIYASLARGSGVFTYTLRDQTRYIYSDPQGQLLSVIDPQGRQVTLTYDMNSKLTAVTDANDPSRRLTFTYQTFAGSPRITSVSDGTRHVQYGYDAYARLTSATDVQGRVTSYTYHPTTGLLHEIRNPLNELVERVWYDSATPPRVTQQTLHDGSQIDFQYLAEATVITTTGVDGRSDVEEVQYGANNAMTGVRLNNQAVLGSAFDDTLSPGTLRDGNNNTTTTQFNDHGQPLSSTNALGQQTFHVYDSLGNLTETTDALGITTRLSVEKGAR